MKKRETWVKVLCALSIFASVSLIGSSIENMEMSKRYLRLYDKYYELQRKYYKENDNNVLPPL